MILSLIINSWLEFYQCSFPLGHSVDSRALAASGLGHEEVSSDRDPGCGQQQQSKQEKLMELRPQTLAAGGTSVPNGKNMSEKRKRGERYLKGKH